MPLGITAAAVATAVAGGAVAGASIYGAHKQADAATTAAQLQTDAATKAATLQKQSTDDALSFSRQQAETDWQNQELVRRANYDQTAAKNARLGTLGNMLGLPPPSMPDYVASVDPRYTTAGTAAPTGSASGAPGSTTAPDGSTPAGTDPITAQLTANYKALGVAPTGRGTGPTDIAYYADQIAKTGGATPQNLAYWMGPQGRIATDLAKAKGGGAATPAAPTSTPTGTLGAMLQPYRVANPTAALTPGGY